MEHTKSLFMRLEEGNQSAAGRHPALRCTFVYLNLFGSRSCRSNTRQTALSFVSLLPQDLSGPVQK